MVERVTEVTEAVSAPSQFFPGAVLISRYRVEQELGKGGAGVVIRAYDLDQSSTVALKILHGDFDRAAEQRFKAEAEAARQLRNDHVVRVLETGVLEDGSPFMAMELLDGEDLGTRLVRETRVPPQLAVGYILQACEGLGEAHAVGIVHRDIKPSNLFVETSGRLKVLDFGIAKALNSQNLALTQTASVLGTPAYMSPEQMRSARTVDSRTDIWSLGVVLYVLVEGRLPFEAPGFADLVIAVSSEAPRPMQTAPWLEPVIARCLAKEARERFVTVSELRAALTSTRPAQLRPSAPSMMPTGPQLRPSTPNMTPSGPQPQPTAPRRRNVALWLAVGLAFAIGIGAAIALAPVDAPAVPTAPVARPDSPSR